MRYIWKVEVVRSDDKIEETKWAPGCMGSVPVCHGGALSVETFDSATNVFTNSVIWAPGTWKRVNVWTKETEVPEGTGERNNDGSGVLGVRSERAAAEKQAMEADLRLPSKRAKAKQKR